MADTLALEASAKACRFESDLGHQLVGVSMEFYRQCELRRDNVSTVAWIPEHGAKVGFSFLFKDEKSEGRWTVLSVGDTRIARADLGRSNVFESIKG